jgi:uncharacterized membrane protein
MVESGPARRREEFCLSGKDDRVMKKLYVGVVVVGLLALVGCSSSPTGGGGEAGGTFEFQGPATETTVKQGETKTIEVTVKKKQGDFKADIKLDAAVDPKAKGIKVELEPSTWKANDPKTIAVKVSADEKADLGKYVITLKGTPDKGNATELPIKIEVKKKD